MKKSAWIVAVMFLGFCSAAQAKIVGQTVEYKDGETTLEGYVAYDDAQNGKRPGVLIVHEWTGLGDYVKNRAHQLAAMGYIAFGADIYGQGVRPGDSASAGATASIYKNDRALMRRRASAGLEAFMKNSLLDTSRIAAIGYCFGGTTVLELARSGAPVQGVVSFHGGLSTPQGDDAKNIQCKVLVLHGADDPYVNAEEVATFEKEMRQGGVDWQLVSYGGAVHSFTNPAAGNDASKGAAYDEKADKRSWLAMKTFLEEIF